MRQKRADIERWQMGLYNLNAFSVALSKALGGRKSHAEYMSEPLFQRAEKNKPDEELTEEEIKQEREKLLMSLMSMQSNFERNRSEGKQG